MKNLYTSTLLFFVFTAIHAQDITLQLDKYLSKPNTFNGTALVVHHGKVLLHKGYGHMNKVQSNLNDTATIYRIGSITKPFTATVIMKLVENGLLNVDDKLSKYLPNYPEGESITIAQLLSHNSGVKEYLAVKGIQDLAD
ncbi:MAG: beta-lactamase family protein, partial [Chitinophagaceae bacterium]|nr:beta-lactamase family protein [Chitinophagaceae bacterium]